MDGFLTKINTWKKKDSSPLSIRGKKHSQRQDQPKSVEDVVEILQNEPDYDSLIAALKFLNPGKSKDSGFALGTPSPQAAKVLQVLITEIIPNYWQLFKDGSLEESSQASKQSSNDLDLLLGCFRSIAGLNSILTCLRTLIQASKNESTGSNIPEAALNLETVVQLLCEALDGDFTLFNVWTASTLDAKTQTSKRPLSQELLVLIGSGKATSLAAEAETIIKKRSPQTAIGSYWVADGRAYSSWLSRNIAQWMLKNPCEEDVRLCAELLTKGLRLGYPGTWSVATSNNKNHDTDGCGRCCDQDSHDGTPRTTYRPRGVFDQLRRSPQDTTWVGAEEGPVPTSEVYLKHVLRREQHNRTCIGCCWPSWRDSGK